MSERSPIGRITYRSNPTKTTYSVSDAWSRLKIWASEHLPRFNEDLNPPATDKQIRDLEKVIGAKIPPDLHESLRIHNGQGYGQGIVFGLQLLSIKSILNDLKNWNKYVAKGGNPSFDASCTCFPPNAVRQSYYAPGWIPLTYDGGGNFIAVDLAPGPKGRQGQIIIFGRDDEFHPVLAWSWAQFLTDLADELEAGNFRLDKTDPDYPAFNVEEPFFSHFHQTGRYWSRGKLGLKKLSGSAQKAWEGRKEKSP
jgi:cell wall assembly regulator SMI1